MWEEEMCQKTSDRRTKSLDLSTENMPAMNMINASGHNNTTDVFVAQASPRTSARAKAPLPLFPENTVTGLMDATV